MRWRIRSLDRLAVQAVFAALVLATIAAFFVTTRLKRSPPVVEQLSFRRHFSPNGDGRLDAEVIAFRLRRSDDVTVSLVNRDDDEIKTLIDSRPLARGKHRFVWNGRTDTGARAPDGEYHVRVRLRKQARSIISPRKLFLDTEPPNPVVRYVSPDVITPGARGRAGRARLRFVGPTRKPPELLVYRTDLSPPRLVAERHGRRGSANLSWDGYVGERQHRHLAPPGNYLLALRTRDAAGNEGPAQLPPRRGKIEGHPGVVVRYLAAIAPQKPVRAGSLARFEIFAGRHRYRWHVRRAASTTSLERGSGTRRFLALRAPRRAGAYLFSLRAGGRRYATPLAVSGRPGARVLVVLPLTSWEALNPIDSNGDGFADRLPADRRVPLRRPFAGTGLPSGFGSQAVPLLRFLDRSGLRYDVGTDISLGTRQRSLKPHRGVLFAGTPRFLTIQAQASLGAYVGAGGRLSWFGVGGLRQPVELDSHTMLAGGASRPQNSFGERVRTAPDGLLTVLVDKIRFFAGVSAAFGPFPAVELTRALPPRARLLASAGAKAGEASTVVYRTGDGVVARLGAQGFASSLDGSPSAERIMRNLWTLLSR